MLFALHDSTLEPGLSTEVSTRYRLHFLKSMQDIEPAAWQALVASSYPFLRHEFLSALERSGCTSSASGWQPCHMLVKDHAEGGRLGAPLPLYLKNHSMGEYVFDWGWADAYHRHGLHYYPKLLSAIPFTPSQGPRLCMAPGLGPETRSALIAFICSGLREECLRLDASGWHLLFPEQALSDALKDEGMLQRLGCQYQWFNHGYRDFTDFLARLSSRKRKNIRKERQRVRDSDIRFVRLHGTEISSTHWQHFYRFYQNTYHVRGREPYLNLAFFLELGRSMPEQILLIMAEKAGRPIAGALSFLDEETFYGRYWGCEEEWQFLHFETCYYQGIDYCIEKGIRRFDAGAQGEHKIQRGFEPVLTFSNHWIAHAQFRKAIAAFIADEARHVQAYSQHAGDFLPFRKI